MATLRLKTLPTNLPPMVAEAAEAAKRAEDERVARGKALQQQQHKLRARMEVEAGRQQRGQQRAADLTMLRERFPAVFTDPPRPLMLGIFQAIQQKLESQISHRRLHTVLHWWTRRDAYLKAVAQGGSRHDLDGHAVEAIDEEQRLFADAILEQRHQRTTMPVKGVSQVALGQEPALPGDRP